MSSDQKIKLALVSFTGCNGCWNALLTNPIAVNMLDTIEIVFFPLLVDPQMPSLEKLEKTWGKVPRPDHAVDKSTIHAHLEILVEDLTAIDLVLVEGAITSKAQERAARKIRKRAKKVVAFGTCAHLGGIVSLAQNITPVEVRALDQVIRVDDYIPGCPPPSTLVGNSIMKLSRGEALEHSDKSQCATCPLHTVLPRDHKFRITRLRPNPGEVITDCFLKHGIMCHGPLTREGCDHRCIKAGLPCDGCFGPVKHDFVGNTVNFLANLDLDPALHGYEPLFFKYSNLRIPPRLLQSGDHDDVDKPRHARAREAR